MTHRLNVMQAPVKFHKYIPYDLAVMARTRIGMYIHTYVRVYVHTNGMDRVTLNALLLFFE